MRGADSPGRVLYALTLLCSASCRESSVDRAGAARARNKIDDITWKEKLSFRVLNIYCLTNVRRVSAPCRPWDEDAHFSCLWSSRGVYDRALEACRLFA